jgi:hypothetical protein
VAVTSPAGLPSLGPPFGFLHQRLAGLDHGLNLLGQRVTGPLLREKLQARNISSTTTMSVIGLATPCSPELHRSRGLHPAATYLRTGPLRG